MTSPKTSIFAAATAMALAPAAVLIFLAPGASAQARGQVASVSVEIADGAKSNASSDRVVREQIKAGARTVCAAVSVHSPLLPREQADCERMTVAEALRKLGDTNIVVASN
jgi:UrcA family protein